ncbi:MAG: right-handed parallel beta-helix repeat-containing protein [Sphingomonadales bacterium]|jgi:parallel beta-helix repeat protein|nr:right-handed parallel beta-helix repeat-containing protein [Sphingomonadales bacterium]MBP7135478.1 right-handed parallel beta-helix repeat-containing protein [Sphingomonadaceae bacterium]MBK6720880.1 right-handed parallel beta-helix repeat-containing protein [Sphingomonadales bacterium]MBK8274022.1 right-handed parallel beta-helix repeat-containing protein [Sphingomonadales bacterium]MBK8862123.1 right-handed parallel beta-helix repeat-containing protein [Sphingomonadales bacterium]
MKPIPFFVAASLLALASPALADTIRVEPGADAQSRLQSALIDAKPGDIVEIGAGRFDLTDGLSLDVDRVTVRGAGPSATILSFKGQKGAGEGLLVTADDVVLRGFAVEDSRGDGIKSKGANRIVYHDLRVEWTGGPKASNGAYGVYPVESSDILIDKVTVKGASDAGIYVGQSKNIIVRNSLAMFNVAGIEIENCYGADVYQNVATHNAGGILVFDLPNLPQKGGHSVRIFSNRSERNDTPNFAPKGNIVAGVPNGTGVIIMANRDVHVFNNILGENGSTNIFIVGYRNSFTDTGYNPLPANVVIGGNMHGRAGYAPGPQFEGGAEMLAAMGSVPPIVWDGTGSNIRVTDKVPTLSLGLTDPKARATSANPAVVDLSQGAEPAMLAPIVLPQSMEAAIR